MNTEKDKVGLGYKMFKSYVGFFTMHFYYRRVYILNTENIPTDCPLLVVANHQNSLNDAFGLLFSLKKRAARKIRAITRASIFANPVASRILEWVGLFPAFRLDYDGIDSLMNNANTFDETAEELLKNGTVIIYPEGRHQGKRWLGKFSHGYLKMLFQAAEKSDFERELFIMPSCNHYSSYFGLRKDMLIKFGTPISLKPYYELYQTKPRTAQRMVNEKVREQVSNLMLNIEDEENYDAIDYLRNTYGVKYAETKGYNPTFLPEKLLADKAFYKELESAKDDQPEAVQTIYDETHSFISKIKQLKIESINFDRKDSWLKILLQAIILVLLFPVCVLGYIIDSLIIIPARVLSRNVQDPMLKNAVQLILTLTITLPLSFIVGFFLAWKFLGSAIIGLVFALSIPLWGLFDYYYTLGVRQLLIEIRYKFLLKKHKLTNILTLKESIYEKLDNLFKLN